MNLVVQASESKDQPVPQWQAQLLPVNNQLGDQDLMITRTENLESPHKQCMLNQVTKKSLYPTS